jgi:outer membrane protein TolC
VWRKEATMPSWPVAKLTNNAAPTRSDRNCKSSFFNFQFSICIFLLTPLASAQTAAPLSRAAQAPKTAAPAVNADAAVSLIDLATVLRLVNASNPTIALARERVREAEARVQRAEVLWLPTLQTGPAYYRHDGQIQNSTGNVFTTSKSNFFEGGGAVMHFDTADALFAPLVARRLATAEAAAAQAVTYDVQLDVALTYLELMRVFGALAVNADTLARAEEMLRFSRNVSAKGVDLEKSRGNVPRAETEVALRRQERIDLEGQAAAVSAHLAQLLLLPPAVDLQPADATIVPITLVPLSASMDDLVATGYMNRPELAESRALVAASLERWRQARLGPLFPKLEVSYDAGVFGGGTNSTLHNFNGRGDGLAGAYWQLDNLGFGDVYRARERRAQYNQANFHVAEAQAQVAAEIVTAAKQAATRLRTLDDAQQAVIQAMEAYRILWGAAKQVTQKRQFDTLEPLIAEQNLAQARLLYLSQVIEYNKAQFRLYWAMGRPPECALPSAVSAPPVKVPVAPPPYQLDKAKPNS